MELLHNPVYSGVFWFSRLFPDRDLTLRVLAGPLRGRRFRANFRDHPYELLGAYEKYTVRALTQMVRPGMVCWDIGANVGYMTLLMQKLTEGGRVHSFEPCPPTYAQLRRNTDEIPGIEAHQLALADTEGTEVFSASASTMMMNMLGVVPGWEATEVQVATGDGLIARGIPAPDVVKIDVEGAEMRVLRGMTELVKQGPAMQIECHSPELLVEVKEFQLQRGYRAEELSDGWPRRMLFVR